MGERGGGDDEDWDVHGSGAGTDEGLGFVADTATGFFQGREIAVQEAVKDGRVVGCFVGFVGAGADGFDLAGDFLVDGVSFGVLFLVF